MTRFGIDDMAVNDAVLLEIALVAAARDNGHVRYAQNEGVGPAFAEGIRDADAPCAAVGLAAEGIDVAAEV